MKKKHRRWPWITLGILAALLLAGFLFVTDGLSAGADLAIYGIDLSAVPDGRYTGTYDFKRWTNTVAVEVRDRAIVDLTVEHDILIVDPTCANEVFKRVLAAQNTDVDAVSGATVSSRAYLKAIENALAR